jgi:hypothetical protein
LLDPFFKATPQKSFGIGKPLSTPARFLLEARFQNIPLSNLLQGSRLR